MASSSFPSFQRGPNKFSSASVKPGREDTRHTENLAYFIAVLQHMKVDILPITWQPGLEGLGVGNSAIVNQSLVNISLSFAFKRTSLTTNFRVLISEVAILSIPRIKAHPNIHSLEGVCWETTKFHDNTRKVWPVLVSPKAELGDLKSFMKKGRGRSLMLQQRLGICLEIAQALQTMHECNVIHGDLKPENILIFNSKASDAVVAKVSDFGYSTMWAGHEEVIYVPKTEPWQAPEWHQRGFLFDDAKKMDWYSFGMVSLWVFLTFESAGLAESLRASIMTEEFDWEKGYHFESLKSTGKLLRLVVDAVGAEFDMIPPVTTFLAIFQATLQPDPKHRIDNMSAFSFTPEISLGQVLGQNFQDMNIVHEIQSGLPNHATLNPTDGFLLLQLSAVDTEIRHYMIEQLKALATVSCDDFCEICKNSASFCLATLSSIGFGTSLDEDEAHKLILRSGRTEEDLQTAKQTVQSILPDHQSYRPGNFKSFNDEGIIELKEPDFAIQDESSKEIPADEDCSLEILAIESTLGSTHVICRQLKASWANYLYNKGHYEEAVRMRREILESVEKSRGPSHIEAALAKNLLSGVLSELGHGVEAHDLTQQAYDVLLSTLGKTHAITVGGMTTLAYVKSKQGHYEDALRLQILAVEEIETRLGRTHPTTCHALLNLSSYFYLLERYPEAETKALDVIERMKESLGEEHVRTQKAKRGLSNVYMDQGRLHEARKLHVELHEFLCKAYGQDHLDTTVALSELAQINHLLGMNEEAETQLKTALRLSTQLVEATNPYCLGIQSVLSNVLAAEGKFNESLEMEMDLCNQMRRCKGSLHPETIVVLTNLANTYMQQNRLKEAEDLELEVLAIKTEKYGPHGKPLLPTQWSLATLYTRQSRLADAEKMWHEVVQTKLRASESNDPFTLRAKSNLASILQRLRKSDEALILMHEALSGREATNGPAHKYTFEAREAIVALHTLNGDESEAEKMDLDTLEICMQHPDCNLEETFNPLHRLGALYARQERLDEAALMFTNEVYRRKQTNNSSKEQLLNAIDNLASVCELQKDYPRAVRLREEVSEGKLQMFGQDHPESVVARARFDSSKACMSENN
ncbi:hypothetical protein BP6252_12135 [Coleophoma cylindrospora]|uniref:Protein kinase domain-containing protein n=1 Tax=Coleophoma cylindrospora TaxID=1849047 RepID=A0A3D8QFZ6_9HELO|nr:hypothetical protein BP6252_12135 [Coleophoma cylindrospora]